MPVTVDTFRLAFEAAPVGMMTVDAGGKITFANAHIEGMFGYAREELLGIPLEKLIPEIWRGRNKRAGKAASAFHARRKASNSEQRAVHKSGAGFPIDLSLTPLPDEDLTLVMVVDITERQRSMRQLNELTAELTDSLKGRDVLLREVHHRVKNNLQVISSLINMQVRKLEPGVPRDILVECKTRFEAVALIHEKLCQSCDYAHVCFSEYISSLADNVLHAADASAAGVSLSIDADAVSLGMNKVIPCGLILNELLTNAMKHAFPEDRGGTIRVSLKHNGPDRVRLTVSDNGVGMRNCGTEITSSSVGLQLVSTLSEQLDGQMQIMGRDGTSVTVEFPADPE
jgi:two-component system, sensor histidine kinase PdtaS